jgi:drug/metabolite transporter, DME family
LRLFHHQNACLQQGNKKACGFSQKPIDLPMGAQPNPAMSYWGETWSLVCAFFWATAVILFRVAVRGIPAIELGLFKNTLALLLFALTWVIFPAVDAQTKLSGHDILILVISGMLGISLGDTLFLYSLKLLGAGRNAILTCLFSTFVILLSFFFLGERFSLLQFLGFLTTLLGIVFAVYRKPDATISKENLVKGTIIGTISVFFMATGMVTTKTVLSGASPVEVACIRLSGGVAGVFLFALITGRLSRSIQVFKGDLPWTMMFLGGFVGSYLALFAWIIGFKYTSASIASILNQTSVFLILIFAAVFLKERLTALKITGALLGFLGVALIIFNA